MQTRCLPYSDARFFFNDTATTEIYTLSLHDALPISRPPQLGYTFDHAGDLRYLWLWLVHLQENARTFSRDIRPESTSVLDRSEEHTSELQSRQYLVCRLLLEKKKNVLTFHLSYRTAT